MDDRGRWEGAVLFGDCSATVPLGDTGGHVVAGASRGGEGQLPRSVHMHTSLWHCLLHLSWASASAELSSQNPKWSLSEPKDAASQSRERPARGWGLEGSNGQFSKPVREGVCLESYFLSSLVLTQCLGELSTVLSDLLAQKASSCGP